MRAQSGHYEVGRQVEYDVAHVEQRQTRRDLVWSSVKDGAEIVTGVGIHGLRKTDIGAHCCAKEVEDPECGDDTEVQFSIQG